MTTSVVEMIKLANFDTITTSSKFNHSTMNHSTKFMKTILKVPQKV